MKKLTITLEPDKPLRADITIADNLIVALAEWVSGLISEIKKKSEVYGHPGKQFEKIVYGVINVEGMVHNGPLATLTVGIDQYEGIIRKKNTGDGQEADLVHRARIVEKFKGNSVELLATFVVAYVLAKFGYFEQVKVPSKIGLRFEKMYQLNLLNEYTIFYTLEVFPAVANYKFSEIKKQNLEKVEFDKHPLNVLPDGRMIVVEPQYSEIDFALLNDFLGNSYGIKIKEDLINEFCESLNEIITKSRQAIYNAILDKVVGNLMEVNLDKRF